MIKMRKFALAAFAAPMALALSACGSSDAAGTGLSGDPIAAIPAPAGTEWSDMVTVTDFDGYRIGNPDAPIALVEYASLTCGACAAFAEQSAGTLKEKYVDSGVVSYEIRNQIHGPDDLILARLARCGAPESFHPLADQVWGNLQAVLGPFYANQAALEQSFQLPEEQRFAAIADQAGFLDFFAARGISKDQGRQCLSDPAAMRTIAENSSTQSEELGVTGTPTFIINGNNVGTQNWAKIEPMLQEAGAR